MKDPSGTGMSVVERPTYDPARIAEDGLLLVDLLLIDLEAHAGVSGTQRECPRGYIGQLKA